MALAKTHDTDQGTESVRKPSQLSKSTCKGLLHSEAVGVFRVGRRATRPGASYPFRLLPALQTQDRSLKSLCSRAGSLLPKMMNADMNAVDAENQVELEEKTQLINQVLELQHTLEDLSARVDAVKEENLKLKSENQVLGQYIENLMSASSVFQTIDTKSKRR
ncbi:short coiled-coil protein-like [Mus musculus]|uniref:short coiled-coil protein-like n=1 Tax=Mus musculus TaxID=10090 RepID=UPI0001552CA2|nr:short coiled-coil protein-like [Mus musculus]